MVGTIEVDRVDFLELDEVLHLDGAREQWFQGLKLARLDGYVAIGRYLIALDDLLQGDLFTVERADVLLVDAPIVEGMDLVEVDRLARDGAVQLYGHADQAEAESPHPHRSLHQETY